MPIPPPSAPYDSLEVVTSLVRTILADYIAGLVPQVAGTVNTNGTLVTWQSGNQFSYLLNGLGIVINGAQFVVDHVTSSTGLVLQSSAGVQAGVTYTAVIETGDIFADSEAYVLPTINLAWRKLQKKLADKGHPRLQSETVISNLPVIASTDPSTQQWIDWTGFFDGVTFTAAPLLPATFISPQRLWERVNGMNAEFSPMRPAGDGLEDRVKGSCNKFWDWRQDRIFLPGSILAMDLRLRFAAYLPDITLSQNSFSATPVPIMRSADALAHYAAAIFVSPRGGVMLVPTYEAAGDQAVDQITNAWAKTQQRGSFHRMVPRGRRGGRSVCYPRGY